MKVNLKKRLFTAAGEILLNVSFDVAEGEMISLFGPSGSGKTTILRMLAGLTLADEGRIQVNGETWFDSERKQNLNARHRRVGFTFQDYALFPNMTLRENLRYAQPARDEKHVDELLQLFDLEALSQRKPDVLSGGQQQRVALARALARKPKLLLLDEPLSAVDPGMRTKLQDEILAMHKKYGITTILVSHDLPEVFKLTSRVLVLKDGEIIRQGNPFEVFSGSKISGKVQLVAEVLKIEKEDIIDILTLLVGNTIVKVAVSDQQKQNYKAGDKVTVITKAFNPVITKIEN